MDGMRRAGNRRRELRETLRALGFRIVSFAGLGSFHARLRTCCVYHEVHLWGYTEKVY